MPTFVTNSNYSSIIGETVYTKTEVDAMVFESGGMTSSMVKAMIEAGAGFIDAVDKYGIDTTNTTDATAKIQQAIDYAITTPGAPKIVYLREYGKYKITDTLHLGYGDTGVTPNGISSVILYGGGKGAYDQNQKGARLFPAADDFPVVNIQGARGTYMVGVAVIGMNTMPENYDNITDPANFLKFAIDQYDNGLQSDASVVDGQYCGHWGATVDLYSGPGGTGRATNAPYGFSKAQSSTFGFIDCTFTKLVAGIVCHPSDTSGSGDSNGDFCEISGCLIKQIKYGVSVGNTQSRNINLRNNTQIDIAYRCTTTGDHGKQMGRINSISDCHLSGNEMAYMPYMSHNTPTKWTSNYSEQLVTLGQIGTTSTTGGWSVFDSCTFNLSHEQIGYIPRWILNSFKAHFRNCTLAGIALNFKCEDEFGEIILDATNVNINAAHQFDPVLNWDSNGSVYFRKMMNHPITLFGNGKLTVKEGCTIQIDRHYGGLNRPMFNKIGSNSYSKYLNASYYPGSTGLIGDYVYKSRSISVGSLTNFTVTSNVVGAKATFRITDLGYPLPFSLLRPGHTLVFPYPEVVMMITKRGIADGLAHADDCEAVITNGFKYLDGTWQNNGYLFNVADLTNTTKEFFWFNTDWYDHVPIHGTASATSDTITGVTFFGTQNGSPQAAAQFEVETVLNFYTYNTTPHTPTSLMQSLKIISIDGAAGTIQLSGNAGITGSVFIFNRNPLQ